MHGPPETTGGGRARGAAPPPGSSYTLMAIGPTLTDAITRVPNFAHAEFITVGGYTAASFANSFGGLLAFGGGAYAAVVTGSFVVAFLVAVVIALATDELVFTPPFRPA